MLNKNVFYPKAVKNYILRFLLLACFGVLLIVVCKTYHKQFESKEMQVEQQVVLELQASKEQNGVKLQWKPIQTPSVIDGYKVFRRIGDGKFQYVDSTSDNEYLDQQAAVGIYNFYRVYPYKVVDGKEVLGVSKDYVYIMP